MNFGHKTTSLLILLTASACGREVNVEEYKHVGEGEYLAKVGEIRFAGDPTPWTERETWAPAVSAANRSMYCAIHAEPERNLGVRDEILQSLEGRWSRHLVEVSEAEAPFGRTFTYSLDSSLATLSKSYVREQDSVHFDRICLSEELKDQGPYTGFRVVELMAYNGDGVTVFGVKFGPSQLGHANPVLLMTAHVFHANGAREPLRPLSSVFQSTRNGERSARIWVYPARDRE